VSTQLQLTNISTSVSLFISEIGRVSLFPKMERQAFADYLFSEIVVPKYCPKKLGTRPVSLRQCCSVGSYEQCLVAKMFTTVMTGI